MWPLADLLFAFAPLCSGLKSPDSVEARNQLVDNLLSESTAPPNKRKCGTMDAPPRGVRSVHTIIYGGIGLLP